MWDGAWKIRKKEMLGLVWCIKINQYELESLVVVLGPKEMYCVMQKGMRQRSQPNKGKDFFAAMLIFYCVSVLERY
jgi:hypothetical protein